MRGVSEDGFARVVEIAAPPELLRYVVEKGSIAVNGVSLTVVSTSSTSGAQASLLVVGNGSAMRTEKAPGHFDDRAEGFDAALGASLRSGRPAVDVGLARELWASVDAIVELGELGHDLGEAQVDYDDAPYGVQYWGMRWNSAG